MPRPLSKKTGIQQYARECGWARIGRTEWNLLRERFIGASQATFVSAMSELGIVVEQPFAGVATKTLQELEVSLVAMAAAYPEARVECRAAVIAAKDRARFASLNRKVTPEKRAQKAEMVEWMLVWLGDPAMFGAWAALRKRAALLQVE